MKTNRILPATVALAWMCTVLLASGTTIHVSPSGDDGAKGTEEQPFASLERAREAARAEIAGGLTADLEVVLHPGTFHLDRPLVLGPADSGTDQHSVTWRSLSKGLVIISGGCEISDWTEHDDGTWSAPIPERLRSRPRFRQLFAMCYWLNRARHPDEGYLRVARVGDDRRSNFEFVAGDLPELSDLKGVELVFVHDWSITRSPIASIDPASRKLTLAHAIAPSNRWSAMDWFEKKPRYFLENAKVFLDAPREWHADWKTGRIHYHPHKAQRPERFPAVAPLVDQLLVVKGTPAKPVQNLHLQGLHFRHAGWRPTEDVYWGRQACTYFPLGKTGHREAHPATIQFEFAENCRLTDGSLRQCGGSGVWFGRSCRKNVLDRFAVSRVGGNGIMIGEGQTRTLPGGQAWWQGAPDQAATGNTVSNCIVLDCGREMFGAVGIWVGLAADTTITHNRLAHLPYTGISLGWMWWNPRTRDAPRDSPARGNTISHNRISRVMQILSDGGGIYTLGNQPGSALVGNMIYDIPRNVGRAESNGMFLDQGTGSFTVSGNLIYNVERSPFRFHKGWTNVVRNNVVSVPGDIPLVRYNDTKQERIRVEENRELPAGEELDGLIKEFASKTGPRKRVP